MKSITTIALSTLLMASPTFIIASQHNWKGEYRDAWIDGKAETSLLLNSNLNSLDISTSVTKRVVTLTGDVNSQLEKALAEELVIALEGVKKVKNQLTVINTNTKKNEDSHSISVLTDAKITAALETLLLMTEDVDAINIEITTINNIVELTGEVYSDTEHDLIINIAKNTNDVLNIIDNLKTIQ
jgi:osmotically-inducible protein OsmY